MTPISEAVKGQQAVLHTQEQLPEQMSPAQLLRSLRYILIYFFGAILQYIKAQDGCQ